MGLTCIVFGVPCMWCKINGIFFDFTTSKDFLSKFNPDTSLIISTPFLIPFIITLDFLVSKDNNAFGNFFLNLLIIIFILDHSCAALIVLDPGLVDSPPISMIFAPSLSINLICLLASFFLKNKPPSEKLSGVTFKIPIIWGLLNFNSQIFFRLETIFFKSRLIEFFILLSRFFISLIGYILLRVVPFFFLLKISSWSKAILELPARE